MSVAAALIDIVIGITVAEGLALVAYHRRTGKGVAGSQFGVNLLAGLSLMLALRLNVGGAGWEWVAASLMLAGALHGLDLWRRWQR